VTVSRFEELKILLSNDAADALLLAAGRMEEDTGKQPTAGSYPRQWLLLLLLMPSLLRAHTIHC